MKKFHKIICLLFTLLLVLTTIHYLSFNNEHVRSNITYTFGGFVESEFDKETEEAIHKRLLLLRSEGELELPLSFAFNPTGDVNYEEEIVLDYTVIQVNETIQLIQNITILLTTLLYLTTIAMYFYYLKRSSIPIQLKFILVLLVLLFIHPILLELFPIFTFNVDVMEKTLIPFLVASTFFSFRKMEKETTLVLISAFYMYIPFLMQFYMGLGSYTIVINS